jgi:hypothetical protein
MVSNLGERELLEFFLLCSFGVLGEGVRANTVVETNEVLEDVTKHVYLVDFRFYLHDGDTREGGGGVSGGKVVFEGF